VIAAVALAVSLLGNPFSDSDRDHARALAYDGMLINAHNPGDRMDESFLRDLGVPDLVIDRMKERGLL